MYITRQDSHFFVLQLLTSIDFPPSVGSARAEFISQCRVAIKANDMNKLLQLLKSGQPKRQHTIANV